jgi:hypothetical protein
MAGRIAYYGNIVRDGLILNLDAAKKDSYPGSGTVWNDISGNGNNGSLVNGPTFDSGNGGSIVLDGTNDYIDTVDGSIFSLISSYTFSVWFMPLNSGSMYPLQRGIDGLGNGWSLLAGVDANKYRVGVVTTSTGNAGFVVQSISNVNVNQWANITGVWNAGVSLSLYVNGAFISSQNITSTILRTSTAAWVFGRLTTTAYSNQRVANCFIYNRVLSATEVLQNYNAQKSRYGL